MRWYDIWWYIPTVSSHDLWERLVDHSRGGLLEPKLSQELLDTPFVPGFDGLIVGNLTGYAIAMAKWPALPRVAAVCVPEGTKLWFSSRVLVHWNSCQLNQHLTHRCRVCHVDWLEHPLERVEELGGLWYTTILSWMHMISIDIRWYQMRCRVINISYRIIIYHIISYHIISDEEISIDAHTFLM